VSQTIFSYWRITFCNSQIKTVGLQSQLRLSSQQWRRICFLLMLLQLKRVPNSSSQDNLNPRRYKFLRNKLKSRLGFFQSCQSKYFFHWWYLSEWQLEHRYPLAWESQASSPQKYNHQFVQHVLCAIDTDCIFYSFRCSHRL